jgi:hypothetical protein
MVNYAEPGVPAALRLPSMAPGGASKGKHHYFPGNSAQGLI